MNKWSWCEGNCWKNKSKEETKRDLIFYLFSNQFPWTPWNAMFFFLLRYFGVNPSWSLWSVLLRCDSIVDCKTWLESLDTRFVSGYRTRRITRGWSTLWYFWKVLRATRLLTCHVERNYVIALGRKVKRARVLNVYGGKETRWKERERERKFRARVIFR